ncbi:SIMPL domain-containing protein [Pseudomaricurvus hydrocarbonicus]|nr:SIMPL domain-containing protein [Aestuariicella hydrocarbonica]
MMGTVLMCLVCVSVYADKIPQVSSSATGVVEAIPDIAVVNGQVQSLGATAEGAVTEARSKLDSVITYLKRQGIQSEHLQAAQVLVNPEWSYPRDKPRELTGYRAVGSFTAKLQDISKLSGVYGGLIAAGATELGSTRFDFSLREDLELQAITKAVELAKKKAEAGLKPLNQTVGEVLSMEVGTQWQQPPVYKSVNMAMRAEASSPVPPQVNVGQQTIEATVSVTFEVD